MPRSGYTLVEMMAGLIAASILLAGMGSTIYIARKASEPPAAVETMRQVSSLTQSLASEIQYATTINQWTKKMVEFVAADLNGDNVADTVRYSLDAKNTSTLRTFNGGTPQPIGPSLEDCELKFDVREITKHVDVLTEGPEEKLFDYRPVLNLGNFAVTANNWVGEYFEPAVPANTLSWRVTNVRFEAKRSGPPDGQVMVQLRRPTLSGLPSNIVLTEVLVAETSFGSSYGEEKINTPNCPPLPPNSGVCVVIKHVSGAAAGDIRFCNLLVNTPNSDMIDTNDSGASWSRYSGKSINHRLFARITSIQAQTLNSNHAARTTYKLKLSGGGGEIRGAVRLLNEPDIIP